MARGAAGGEQGHGGGWGRMNRSSPPRALSIGFDTARPESPVLTPESLAYRSLRAVNPRVSGHPLTTSAFIVYKDMSFREF
jgi:hypothetical protein